MNRLGPVSDSRKRGDVDCSCLVCRVDRSAGSLDNGLQNIALGGNGGLVSLNVAVSTGSSVEIVLVANDVVHRGNGGLRSSEEGRGDDVSDGCLHLVCGILRRVLLVLAVFSKGMDVYVCRGQLEGEAGQLNRTLSSMS